MNLITEAERESIKAQLAELDAAQEAIRKARKPFDDAVMAVEGVREALLERYEAETAGTCATCGKLLFTGEKGYRDEDVVQCAEHAPTFADWQANIEAGPDAFEDAEVYQQSAEALAKHLSAGAALTDTIPLFEL